MAAQGMDSAMFTYIRAAMQAAGLKLQGDDVPPRLRRDSFR